MPQAPKDAEEMKMDVMVMGGPQSRVVEGDGYETPHITSSSAFEGLRIWRILT